MNRRFVLVYGGAALAITLALAAMFSAAPILWFVLLGSAFVVAVLLPLGDGPVLTWIVMFNMLSVAADVFNYELAEQGAGVYPVIYNQDRAIIYSCAALVALAAGMRVSLSVMQNRRPIVAGQESMLRFEPSRIFILYAVFLPFSSAVSMLAAVSPGLVQPAYALGLVRFAIIYWLSATAFAANRHYTWLAIVIFVELVVGSTGAFASYKEGFFVVLIALVASRRRLSFRQAAIAAAGAAVIIYMSLIWSVVKMEYRSQIVGQGPVSSVSWLAKKYVGGDVDLRQGASILLERIGYTTFYAFIIDRNTERFRGIYLRAIEHVLTPRLLFPDKAALSDSAETNQVLNSNIGAGTSIGLGYVAEAHIDFGFPGLLVPIFGLGAVVALIYVYFTSRNISAALRDAFAVGCLFNCLAFERDINKEFGGMTMGFLILSLALKFAGGRLITFCRVRSPTPFGLRARAA